jgi:hypothetical protein
MRLCNVCGEGNCVTLGVEPSNDAQHAQERNARHWRRGYEITRARLVEVERELAAARAYGATMDLGHDMAAARALQAESRASAAEGALRTAKRWFEDEQSGPWQPVLASIDLALSGLPLLASETAGPALRVALFAAKDFLNRTAGTWAAPHSTLCYCMEEGGECPAPAIREEAKSLLRTVESALAPSSPKTDAELLGDPAIGVTSRAAQPTPAALVPKEAATPKAIAGEHKEEGRDG